ncbi:hypothetical protein JJB07_14965 [Tumebacillus sp. ITR2]|uniref:Uncharacterized protein n=1 Tax=Tumebacillus amylolyticus TaxID=2801339 RepID=A0ABS1JCE0_9BACL|nr:hypothetical protein [Tumebacillus amylolyticus]MBL0387940.1 hypothetical protein [Tumebacillus amylolyticus]
MNIKHLYYGRDLVFPRNIAGKIVLKKLTKKDLQAFNSIELVEKFRSELKKFNRSTLTNYLRVLEADYEDWSTFNAGVVQMGNSMALAFTVIFIGLMFKWMQDSTPHNMDPNVTFPAILIAGQFIMGLAGIVIIVLGGITHQKVSFKKSKGKLLIKLIEEILESDYDEASNDKSLAEAEVAATSVAHRD